MSKNTAKTEMVAEMKPADNENKAEEGRSLKSRTVNYTIHEKQQ